MKFFSLLILSSLPSHCTASLAFVRTTALLLPRTNFVQRSGKVHAAQAFTTKPTPPRSSPPFPSSLTMAAREGTGGGTGFLFGNIDKRGRLDEDYMSDEAKDTIDNIGSKVVEKDRELVEITNALPHARRPSDSSDDEDYDDNLASVPNAEPKVDYYDEDDLLDDGMDEKERSDMAALALRKAEKAQPIDDDDENYDDDDDDVDNRDDEEKETVQPLSTKNLPPPAHVVPAPADKALQEQQKLMAQAREMTNRAAPLMLTPAADGDEPEEDPLHFSQVFNKPQPPLRFTPRRRRFGLVVRRSADEVVVENDDTDALERPQTPDAFDPVGVVLAMDKENEEARKPRGGERRGKDRLNLTEMENVVEEEYMGAAALLGTGDGGEREDSLETDIGFALMRQVAWEDDIQWQDDDDDISNSDIGDTHDMHIEPLKEATSGNEEPATQASVNNDEDDDEDDFEEPVIMNADQDDKGNKPKDLGSDSEDDMEWEDGNQASKYSDVAQQKSDKPASPQLEGPKEFKSSPLNLRAVPPPPQPPESAPRPKSAHFTAAIEPENSKLVSNLSTAEGNGTSLPSVSSAVAPVGVSASAPIHNPGKDLMREVLAPNEDLKEGAWVEDIVWDSHSDEETTFSRKVSGRGEPERLRHKFSRLILDVNDPNMIFERLSDNSQEKVTQPPTLGDVNDGLRSKAKMIELVHSSGTHVQRLLESDRFNISNDIYYASGASNFLKVDRRSILLGLQNAPPAVKCQTTKTVPTEAELLSFHRPVLTMENLPKNMKITPFRRKRPKGGHAQIAGQIPKKKTELFCSEKDAFRVSLYEYALERQPCILPVPGMASRIVTYSRKESAAAAAQALKSAAGTAEADTVFMSPDEPPPLHAGDLEANGKPLSVVESHVYAAPCVRRTAFTTDFLLVRNGDNMYVREIDSIISLGVTEPNVEIMAPNTERFKKYSRERALLWVLREFSRMRKDQAKQQQKDRRGSQDDGSISLDKEAIMREFGGKKTYSEAVLFKMVKEFTKYHNGKYTLIEDPAKSLAMRENEVLRTVTPQETAAFESMEAGWENLLNRGIQIFTHPSNQGNLLAAAERSGLEAGPAVGAYIKSQLLKTPWYRSQNIISAQRQQKKELMQVLSLARIVNDLKEGGAVMESRLMSLTAAEMNNVLVNHYRLNTKKIPTDPEERRVFVREMAQKKGKSSTTDLSDYSKLIANVLKKHRNLGVAKSGANAPPNSQPITGTFLGMPLHMQRKALEDGDVGDLQTEDEEFAADIDAAAALAATGDDAFGKRPPTSERDGKSAIGKRKPPKPKQARNPASTEQAQHEAENVKEQAELTKLLNSSAMNPKTPEAPKSHSDEYQKRPKKKVTKLKLTKKFTGSDGKQHSVVETVTDPAEIAKLLERREKKSLMKKNAEGQGASSGKLKVAIDLRMLQQSSKSTGKKKLALGAEKKKPVKKAPPKPNATVAQEVPPKLSEKGSIGKVKISTKQLRQERDQAALKRKRSQYGDDTDYPAKKVTKTSRRKRNGTVQLNSILEKVEKTIRETQGYVVPSDTVLKIARLRDGESPPVGVIAKNLATPEGTGLDFTTPVDTKAVPAYKQIVKKPMYLNLVRQNCKRMVYQTATEFIADMELLVKNATDFNRQPDSQWVVQHAKLLLEVAIEQISRKADEIKTAEEMVKLEKVEAKTSGGNSNSKKKSKKNSEKKGQGSKKGQNSKKKTKISPEVINIDDDQDDGPLPTPLIDLEGHDERTDQDAGISRADPRPIGSSDPAPSPSIDASSFPGTSPAPDVSPFPAASPPLFDSEMAEYMYSMDSQGAAATEGEDIAVNRDNLVLDLDDMRND